MIHIHYFKILPLPPKYLSNAFTPVSTAILDQFTIHFPDVQQAPSKWFPSILPIYLFCALQSSLQHHHRKEKLSLMLQTKNSQIY